MSCPQCGAGVEETFNYCPSCGMTLHSPRTLKNVPADTKKGHLLGLMTIKQMSRLATTSKAQAQWLQPILRFLSLPLKKRISILKDDESPTRKLLTEDIIMSMLSKTHDHILLISLLRDLSNASINKNLKKQIQQLLEDRIKDRSYKKLIKKTIIKDYVKHLIETDQTRRIRSFLHEITSPEVKSQVIQQYLSLAKKELSPKTMGGLIQMIPDTYIRETTRRTLLG